MIKSVARNYPWASPQVISEMFVDSKDFMGLEYWYKDAKEQQPKK